MEECNKHLYPCYFTLHKLGQLVPPARDNKEEYTGKGSEREEGIFSPFPLADQRGCAGV